MIIALAALAVYITISIAHGLAVVIYAPKEERTFRLFATTACFWPAFLVIVLLGLDKDDAEIFH